MRCKHPCYDRGYSCDSMRSSKATPPHLERRPPVVYTGQSVKRFEDPRLLTGQGTFLDDLKFAGMLHAAVLRSPHAHAHITSIDTTAARRAHGVVAVLTAEDFKGVFEPLPTRQETE